MEAMSPTRARIGTSKVSPATTRDATARERIKRFPAGDCPSKPQSSDAVDTLHSPSSGFRNFRQASRSARMQSHFEITARQGCESNRGSVVGTTLVIATDGSQGSRKTGLTWDWFPVFRWLLCQARHGVVVRTLHS